MRRIFGAVEQLPRNTASEGSCICDILRNISYEMRLNDCGLTALETRRLRGDQIEVFRILNGYENMDRNIFSRLRKIEGLEEGGSEEGGMEEGGREGGSEEGGIEEGGREGGRE